MSDGNLPPWAGASAVYSYLYAALEKMAPVPRAKRRRLPAVHVDPTTKSVIEALGKGDEETLKGLALHHRTHGVFP